MKRIEDNELIRTRTRLYYSNFSLPKTPPALLGVMNAGAEMTVAMTDAEMTDVEMTDVEMTDVEMTNVEMTNVEMTNEVVAVIARNPLLAVVARLPVAVVLLAPVVAVSARMKCVHVPLLLLNLANAPPVLVRLFVMDPLKSVDALRVRNLPRLEESPQRLSTLTPCLALLRLAMIRPRPDAAPSLLNAADTCHCPFS